jgi:hypothetical protein
MDRNTLVAELLGHGNHMVVTASTRPEDMAKSMGLMLLALGEMLEPKNTFGSQRVASPAAAPRMTAGARPLPYISKASSRF